MRLLTLLALLLSVLAVIVSAAENGTKPARKTLRMVKKLKKSSKQVKKSSKNDEQKSESFHLPIIVSPDQIPHEKIPVNIEIHDDERYIKSDRDLHPIEPIHLIQVGEHHQQHQPFYVEANEPSYSAYSPENAHEEKVFHGPVAVPLDYPYGEPQSDNPYDYKNEIAPQEYYPPDYGDLSAIPGSPGVDYPTYSYLPWTGFKCLEHTSTPGFYADVETKCQMWHYCQPDGRHDRFLCPNGTVFDQLTRVCNWWFNVDCGSSLVNYDINFDLYREPVQKIHQNLDATPYQKSGSLSSPQLQPFDANAKPNSFLGHIQDFEAAQADLSHLDQGPRRYDESFSRPIQAAASPQVQRYPVKIVPAPKVRHDNEETVPIDYDSSSSHSFSTVSDEPTEKAPYTPKSLPKKRVARRKLRKQPKISVKYLEDDIPTYREGKATPSPGKRLRIVRRRKIHRD
ncbi:hypothetical protein X975_25760, partial [Stegodyphus mimosarum]